MTNTQLVTPTDFDENRELIASIGTAHEMAQRCRTEFERSGTHYALYVLRAGCLLSDLKSSCPKGRFEAIASATMPELDERTRQRYMQAFRGFVSRQESLDAGSVLNNESEAQTTALEIITPDTDTDEKLSDPRKVALLDMLRAPDFEGYLKNGRVRQSIYSRVKGVIGDRGVTKLYRDAGVVPDLKTGQGKPRGGYTKTTSRQAVTPMGQAYQVGIIIAALDANHAPHKIWEVLAADIAPVFAKHGFTLTATTQS
ncbi:MAG: hypothetical protein SFY80_10155 [Verrucomicrobiota bacterium]|nr:hypothetical protein [Verrucomicrobiota bacterium]